MKPSEALISNKQAVLDIAARYKTTNARVFGSVVRGSDVEGSDLDVLVDPLRGTTLFDLGGLQDELQELLGVPVEVLTPGDLPPHVLKVVLMEAQPV